MKKIVIIFGNITFENNICHIHCIDGKVMINKDEAEQFADQNINYFDGYVIPDLYDGQIIFECSEDFNIN